MIICGANSQTLQNPTRLVSPEMSDPKHSKSASEHIKTRARQLRRDATIPERVLWSLLRDRRLNGVKFRRQHPIGPYIVDFYCGSHGLVVELDGRSHDDRGLEDRRRQEYLESVAGLRVIRVGNDDVFQDRESVLLGVLRALGLEII
jgi:very-short-patch-repair endonuclease